MGRTPFHFVDCINQDTVSQKKICLSTMDLFPDISATAHKVKAQTFFETLKRYSQKLRHLKERCLPQLYEQLRFVSILDTKRSFLFKSDNSS